MKFELILPKDERNSLWVDYCIPLVNGWKSSTLTSLRYSQIIDYNFGENDSIVLEFENELARMNYILENT